ncbi:MAG: DMT family transporter [Oscillospiraceae bacterium]|nr:DMT family transporter [Oscillospiraceae bacterium]MBQ6850528.1 DMT family transporter [Oscillospiraceae bacterium]
MKKSTAILMLIIVTVIWGGGFIGIKMALDGGMTAGTLNMARGFIFTAIVFGAFHQHILNMSKAELLNGILVGTFNALGFITQAVGALYTTPSNSSFLTTTNVVMVPFMAWAIFKVRPKLRNLVAVAVCMAGMGVLTGAFETEFILNIGDLYTVIGALFFGLSIVFLAKQPEGGHFSTGAFMMGITLFMAGAVYTVLFENISLAAIPWAKVIWPVLYLAVGSNFVAQSMQIVAQRYLSASTACLILMLEGVFGSVFSVMFGYEPFTMNLLLGGGLIVCSLILSEVQVVKKKETGEIVKR